MMRNLLIAAVLVASGGIAAADSCKAEGDVLVQITQDHIANAKKPVIETTLYANGAWTYKYTADDGKVGRTANGCLDKGDLKALNASIASVPWTVTQRKVRCMAMAQQFTRVTVKKVSLKKMMCADEALDDKSDAVLADITKKLEAQTAEKK